MTTGTENLPGPTAPSRGHLRDYWQVVWQAKWMVLTIAVVVCSVVTVYTLTQTEIFRATAKVEIQPRPKSLNPSADFTQLGATGWGWMADDRYINTQKQIITGRAVAHAVLEELGLAEIPPYSEVSDPAGRLANRVKLDMMLDTYVLEISIEDPDPAKAQLLVNTLAEVYIAQNVENAFGNARRVLEELTSQLSPIRARIAELEDERFQLARQLELYVPDPTDSATKQRINQLQEELTEIRISRASLEATLNAIEEIERRGGSFLGLDVVANDPVVIDLNTQAYSLEKELEKLALEFRREHPTTKATRAELDDIYRQREAEASKIIAKVKTQAAIDERRERDLQGQLRAVRAEGMDRSRTSVDIAMLEGELKEQRRLYDTIMSRIGEIDLNRETMTNNVRLLENAVLPTSPVRPRKALNIAAGVALGLLLGIGAAFFVDYLDNTIKTPEDIEHYLGLPLLSVVPRVRKETSAAISEAYQTLRTSVMFGSKSRTLRTILVTSSGAGEGKSTTIVQLARSLASAGDRVVLVDGDLRRPTVHSHLGLPRDGGLTDHLLGVRKGEGGDGYRAYVKQIPGVPQLDVLTCGPIPPNPAELFGAAGFTELLDQLRKDYDWVLIDSPPVAALSDSLILGSLVDMVVLVIRHNNNDREMIRRSVKRLREIDAHIVGAVLNDVDRTHATYKDHYYGNYDYTTRREEDAGEETSRSRRLGA